MWLNNVAPSTISKEPPPVLHALEITDFNHSFELGKILLFAESAKEMSSKIDIVDMRAAIAGVKQINIGVDHQIIHTAETLKRYQGIDSYGRNTDNYR